MSGEGQVIHAPSPSLTLHTLNRWVAWRRHTQGERRRRRKRRKREKNIEEDGNVRESEEWGRGRKY